MLIFARHAPMVVALILSAVQSTPAFAQTTLPPAITVDANVTLTSDYRFRGISQSNLDPAVQGALNIDHRSGLYVGTFVSTISRYVVDGADPEIDLYTGIRKTIGGTSLDAGLLYYIYPGTVSFAGNSFEPYLTASRTLGPVTAKLGGNIAWKQLSLGLSPGERRSALYTYGELSVGIPTTPITLNSHLGQAHRATFGTFGATYMDWSLGATYVYKGLNGTLTYVDTNKNIDSYLIGDRHNRNVSGAGLVATIGYSF